MVYIETPRLILRDWKEEDFIPFAEMNGNPSVIDVYKRQEPFIIDVAPTDDSDFVLSSHEGEEFIMVMEGTMEISYGKNTYLLEEGDSIYYDSSFPHLSLIHISFHTGTVQLGQLHIFTILTIKTHDEEKQRTERSHTFHEKALYRQNCKYMKLSELNCPKMCIRDRHQPCSSS